MKKLLLISSSILVAAGMAALITLVAPYDFLKEIESNKPAPVIKATERPTYPLNVVDGTAPDLSAAEWKSLFDGFSDKLTDPTSAQVRRLTRSAKVGIVCGEVNARNKLGGYVGFVPFTAGVALPRALIVMADRRVVEAMPEEVNALQIKMGCPR